MSLKKRRILFIIIVLLFAIVAPLLLFHTSGYRYDFKKNKFVKTGIIVLAPKPDDVEVYINNEKTKLERQENGFRITNLLPDEYLVRIEKEGYISWQKTLLIESQQTTFINDVLLFKIPHPLQILSGEIIFGDQHEDKTLAIKKSSDGDILYLLHTDTAELTTLFPLSQQNQNEYNGTTINSVEWSANGEKILIEASQKNFLVLDIRNPFRILALADFVETNPNNLHWSSFGDHLLYSLNNNILSHINLNNKTSAQVALLSVEENDRILEPFSLTGTTLHYFRQTPTHIQLESVDIGQQTLQAKNLLLLNKDAELDFIESNAALPHFIDQKNEKIYIFNPQDFTKVTELNAQHATLSNSGASWLYNNNFELWAWSWEKNQTKLINRYSQPITESVWHPLNGYVVYAHPTSLHLIEIDTRDILNDYLLANGESLSGIQINSQGTRLFYISQQAAPEVGGLFTLELQ